MTDSERTAAGNDRDGGVAARDSDERTAACDSDVDGPHGHSGHRFVLALYAGIVAVAAVAGLLTGTFVDGLRPPRFLFLVPFPATPLGFAAYGGLTVALALGVPLALVRYVSREFDGGG